MVLTLLSTVCTSQEKELALLSLLLPLVHIVYQDTPHLLEQPSIPGLGPGLAPGPGLGSGMGEGTGLDGVVQHGHGLGPGLGPGPGQGQIPDYWTPSTNLLQGQGQGQGSIGSSVTSVCSETPHMVVRTPAKYSTDVAKGEKDITFLTRALPIISMHQHAFI